MIAPELIIEVQRLVSLAGGTCTVDSATRALSRRLREQSGPDHDAMTAAVQQLLAELAEMAGEDVPEVDPDQIRQHLAALLSQAVGEGCVPNKDGEGYHDDKTGHPCKGPGGEDAPKQDLDGHADAIEKASPASGMGAKVKAAVAKIGKKAVEKYQNLERDFGRAGAVAILAASVALLPVPVPGTAYVPLLAARAFKAVKDRLTKKPAQTESGHVPIRGVSLLERRYYLQQVYGADLCEAMLAASVAVVTGMGVQ